MMELACAAIGPNGERCARAAGHPGQHVPVPKGTASAMPAPATTPSPGAPGALDPGRSGDAEAAVETAWAVPPEPLVRTDQALLGMLMLALLYGLGTGIATLGARWTAASDAAAAAAHAQGVSVAGRGDQTTTTFSLEGDYLVRWAATPSTANGCYHAAVLERADSGHQVELLVNEAISGSAARSGTALLSGLARNDYRVHASSDCSWTFAFEGR